MTKDNTTAWLNEKGTIILLVAGVAGMMFIMLLLKHLINPLGYALIVATILYPIRKQPVARALLYGTMFMVGFWLIYDSGHLLIPFIIAYIFAFIVNPLVVRLQRRKIARWVSAMTVTLIGFVLVTLFFTYGAPVITLQMVKIGKIFYQATYDTNEWVEGLGVLNIIEQLGLDREVAKTQIVAQLNTILVGLNQSITTLSSKQLAGAGNIIGALFSIILLPFLLFFMIRDYDKIGRFLKRLITPKGVSSDYITQIGNIVGSYLRGLFIVVIISMVNLSLGFYLFNVPYALLLGLFAGLTNFIPTFGLWLAVTACTIVASTLGDPWYQYLPGIYIVFALEQILESGFIVPRVVGKQVGLHPLLVMISLLLFGFMFKFWGLLIAVPTVALLSIFYEQYQQTQKISFLSGAELESFLEHLDEKNKSTQANA